MKRVSLASHEAPNRSPSTKCGPAAGGWPMEADGIEWQSIRMAMPNRLRVDSSRSARAAWNGRYSRSMRSKAAPTGRRSR